MDPRDRLAQLSDGATCTACGAPVPTDRIKFLARRDDLAFVELACLACGSVAIGLLMPATGADGEAILDVDADLPATGRPGRGATVRRITDADVDAVRADLAAWQGDLVGWLDTLDDPGRRGSAVDR
jgi:hypothetical protein